MKESHGSCSPDPRAHDVWCLELGWSSGGQRLEQHTYTHPTSWPCSVDRLFWLQLCKAALAFPEMMLSEWRRDRVSRE